MVAIARFKDLCIDAVEPMVLGPFWAGVLRRSWEADDEGEGRLVGPTPQHTIWINKVPEAKAVKHRVHFDVYASSLAELEVLGSSRAPGWDELPRWTVMVDPEDGEYCAFLREAVPTERLHGLVVDSADAAAQARWWGAVYGAPVEDNPRGFSTVKDVPGMPITTMDFIPVPEAKVVKNRVHWDVSVADLAPLVDAGATILRQRGGDIRWHVMADPEGNEFCAFVDGESC